MRKSLRTLAIVALTALPFAASAQLTIKPVWVNGVENDVPNPIPGLDADWDKPTPTHKSEATATRFGVGKDGKIIVNNHMENALMAWDGKQLTKYFELPAVTTDKWNGTALSTDDAGNLILNFNFTDATGSVTKWAVLDKDNKLTEVTLSTPLSELNLNGRLDIISHIVGDVTSEKGGIGYSTIKGTDHLVMFHFKGDGTKVTSLTAKASSVVPNLEVLYSTNGIQTEVYQAACKYLTIDEILASSTPENEFYLAVGCSGGKAPSFNEGILANFNGTEYAPLTIGNVGYGSTATMMLGGEKYIIRNYSENPGGSNVMTFGIYDMNQNLVASWTNCELIDGFGSETFTVEAVDANTANIYVYVAIGQVGGKGAYGGMFTVTTGDAGFADIINDNDAPAVYYNLQGVRVSNPDNGIYIVRRGNKVAKELIRK